MTADVAALRYWLLHPDRAYTPHELAMEAVRRIDQAAPNALPPANPSLMGDIQRGAYAQPAPGALRAALGDER